jgi:hypothetical protein
VEDETEDEEDEVEEVDSDEGSDIGGEFLHITPVHFPFLHRNL